MAYVLFHDHFPQIAEKETRTIIVGAESDLGVPPGKYGFLEMFCDEPGCDCRRVFLAVVSDKRKKVDAIIAWGWEKKKFYVKWLKGAPTDLLADLMGPALNIGSPQSRHAPALLNLVKTVLLRDAEFVARVKEHYRIMRAKIDGGSKIQ